MSTLTAMKKSILRHKIATSLILTSGFVCGSMAAITGANAAIPVIDTANIAKQAQTYAETVKVVSNTAEQIALLSKNLKLIDQATYDKWMTAIKTNKTKLDNVMAKNGGALGKITGGTVGINGTGGMEVDVSQFLEQNFPGLSKNSTLSDNQQAVLAGLGAVMRNNENTLQAYQEIMKGLDTASSELNDLLKASKNVSGSVQAMQISNAIAVKKAEIDSYKTALSTLDAQQKILTSQAEAQQKKNDIDYRKNAAEANKAAREEMHANLEADPGINPFDLGWGKYSLWK